MRVVRALVARSGDRRLERVAGSRLGLRLLAGALARRIARAGALPGDVQLDVRVRDGGLRHWTVQPGGTARAGAAATPALTVTVGAADLARIAAGELAPDRALLDGRLDVAGDFAVVGLLTDLVRERGPSGRAPA